MINNIILWLFGISIGIQNPDLYGVKFVDIFLFFYIITKIIFIRKIYSLKFTTIICIYLTPVLVKTFFQELDLILAVQQLIRFILFWCTVEFMTEVSLKLDFGYCLNRIYQGMATIFVLSLLLFALEKCSVSLPFGFTTIHTAYPGRFKGFYLDPNYLTTMILVMISIFVYLKKKGILNYVVLGSMYLGVLYTVSRSGTFFITIALIPVAKQIINRNRHLNIKTFKLKSFFYVLTLLATSIYFSDSIYNSVIKPYLMRLDAITANSIDERSMLRDIAFLMIEDNPNLGVGIGNFRVFSSNYMSPLYKYYIKEIDVHNTYLNELATNGIWISFLYFILLTYPLLMCFRKKTVVLPDIYWCYFYIIFLMFGLMLNIETSRVFFLIFSILYVYFSKNKLRFNTNDSSS